MEVSLLLEPKQRLSRNGRKVEGGDDSDKATKEVDKGLYAC